MEHDYLTRKTKWILAREFVRQKPNMPRAFPKCLILDHFDCFFCLFSGLLRLLHLHHHPLAISALKNFHDYFWSLNFVGTIQWEGGGQKPKPKTRINFCPNGHYGTIILELLDKLPKKCLFIWSCTKIRHRIHSV